MKIQLALDRLTEEKCFDIVHQVEEEIDWIEIGTGVIKEYGVSIIKSMKKKFPEKLIVADMKTCDAGKHETLQALEAGADITTVMAFSSNQTIQDSIEIANHLNKNVMIDLLGISSKDRVQEIKQLGAKLVSLHYGKDLQKTGEFDLGLFDLVKDDPYLRVAVAGGIGPLTLPAIVAENPAIVIVGSAITKADDPKEIAAIMRKMISRYKLELQEGGF